MSILSWLYTILTRLRNIEKKVDQIIDILTAPILIFELEGEPIDMLNMTDSQQQQVNLVIKDKNGKPAKVDGVPTWVVGDPSICTVTVAADGMSGLFKGVAGTSGETVATVDADADLGPGVTDIIAVLSIVVTAGQATVIELQAGAPVEQP